MKLHQVRTVVMFALMFILFFSVSVVAQPFVQESTRDTELTIISPKNEFFKLGSMPTIHFHVINSSGFQLLNVEASCLIHVYNSTNGHVLILNLSRDSNGVDFFFPIDDVPAGQRVIGLFPYIVACNSTSGEGGFFSSAFEVTVDGFGDDSFSGWLPIILIFALSSALSLFASFLIRSRGLQGLRALLFLFGIIGAVLLWVLPYLISVNAARVSSFNPIALGMVGIALVLILTVIWFYALFLFQRGIKNKENKGED